MHAERGLSSPHGNTLVDLVVDHDQARELELLAARWPDRILTMRQRCDLELLASGAFSPLTRFLNEADHAAVCDRMRLADGTLWPILCV